MVIEMTYDEASAIVTSFAPATRSGDWRAAADELQALAETSRLDAIRPACAIATLWRDDLKKSGFVLPPLEMVTVVEYLIGEPVWEHRYRHYYGLED